MDKLHGTVIDNGDTCKGMNYISSDGLRDLAIVDIDERYPSGLRKWSKNKVSSLFAVVATGSGELLLKDEVSIKLNTKDSVEVPAGTRYAWLGHMTIVMTCSPIFTREQYEIEEGR